jgi:hypothetical protein
VIRKYAITKIKREQEEEEEEEEEETAKPTPYDASFAPRLKNVRKTAISLHMFTRG